MHENAKNLKASSPAAKRAKGYKVRELHVGAYDKWTHESRGERRGWLPLNSSGAHSILCGTGTEPSLVKGQTNWYSFLLPIES